MIEIKKVKSLFVKNAKQMWRDKVRLVSMLIFPLLMIGLFGSAVRSGTTGIPTGIVYQEDSMYAKNIAQAFHSSEMFTVKKRAGNMHAGKGLMDKGEIDVLIILPRNLEENIKKGKMSNVRVMVDEANHEISSTSLRAAQRVIQEVSSKFSVRLIQGLQEETMTVSQALRKSGKTSQNLAETLDQQKRSLGELSRNLRESSNSLKKTTTGLEKIKNSLDKLAEGDVKVSKVDDLVGYTKLLVRNSNATNPQKKRILGNLSSVGDGVDGIQEVVQMQSSSASKLSGSVDKIQGKVGSIGQGLEEYSSKLSEGGSSMEMDDLPEKNLDEVVYGNPSFFSSPLEFEQETAYGKNMEYMDFLAPGIIALTVFMGAVMGLGRAIAGERKEGSLTRIFLTPTSNLSIVLGTGLFYTLFEFSRGLIVLFSSIILFGLTVQGSFGLVFLILGIYALGSVGLGLFISSQSRSEEQFQAVSMVAVMPMMFISGIFFPVENMPEWLQSLSKVMPMRYAADALRGVMVKGLGLEMITTELMFLSIFAIITITLGTLFFKREVIT